jgi:signal transduction histidine kinase
MGMILAIPLWSERGLIGVLLLGEKHSGGLYTQEEIEIARATGERLIDARASMEMSRRLIALQRERLVQSQVLDQRTRRAVHDEILPLVHMAILNLTADSGKQDKTRLNSIDLLAEIHRQLSDLLRMMPTVTTPEVARLGLLGAIRRTIEQEMQDSFDEVTWQTQAEAVRELECVQPLVAEVMFFAAREAIRNAARYGRGKDSDAELCLSIEVKKDNKGLRISIEDNGVGLASDEWGHFAEDSLPVEGAPVPNPSSEAPETATRGSGQGLALHSTMMAVIGGSLSIESIPGQFTRVSLELTASTFLA